MTDRAGVLGWPVAHSRSPAIHEAAYAAAGLEGWRYQRLPVPPEVVAETIRALPGAGFSGANVTIPHKEAALALADRASESARAIGAANTLTFTSDGVEAENTDASGLIEALDEPLRGKHALVLGAGGSARAAVWALREAGADVSVWNRTGEKAEDLARAFDVRLAGDTPQFDLLLNCTTIGLAQASERPPDESDLKALPLDADAIQRRHTVVDLVYGSHDTALAAIARDRGARIVDGLEVLVRQGAASFRIWTGLNPPIEPMREAARAI